MSKKVPLDMSELQEDGISEVPELEIVDARRDGEVPRKFQSLSDFELDDKILSYNDHLKLNLKDKGAKVIAKLKDLKAEKLHRTNKGSKVLLASKGGIKATVNGGLRPENVRPRITRSRHFPGNSFHNSSKTDCNGRQGNGLQNNDTDTSFSEEIDIFSRSKGKRPFEQLSANAEVSSRDRPKYGNRIFSGDRAGPAPRQGQASNFRHDDRCNCAPISSTIENSEDEALLFGTCQDQQGRVCDFSATEEKVVELFSSEDEDERRIQEHFAERDNSKERLYRSGRSPNPRRNVGTKIAYPTREDPDAVEVLYTDLSRLAPLEFLNDTIIDFYIKYVQRPELQKENHQNRFYFFNSFFYKKLSEIAGAQNKKNVADLSKLRKWTRGTNIFEKDYLFVPIHDKWHWSLAIICHPGAASENSCLQRYILHLDSMTPGHKSNAIFKLLRTYLRAEWQHQADDDGVGFSNRKLAFDEFLVKKVPVPQQENESDCGLFLLHYIECFLEEAPNYFKISDVDHGKLFGRKWFKPSEASNLRKSIFDLLTDLFESSGTSEISASIQELGHQRSENHSILGDQTLDSRETGAEEATTAVPSPGLSSRTPDTGCDAADCAPGCLPCEGPETGSPTRQTSLRKSSPSGGLDLDNTSGSRDKLRRLGSADDIEHKDMTTLHPSKDDSGNNDEVEVGLVVDILPLQEEQETNP